MPTKYEARRLSGVDIGKTVTGVDVYGVSFSFPLRRVEHDAAVVELWAPHDAEGYTRRHLLGPTGTVTITGKPS